MSYTLFDAIREEADLLDQYIKYYDELQNKDKDALSLRDIMQRDTWRSQKSSYQRIVNRFENGVDFNLGIKDGKTTLIKTQTTRHLEREYPEITEAKANLDSVVQSAKLVDKMQETYKGE
jgi:hypothetical protein